MITTCTGCQTRYKLNNARVPRRLIRVRCPKCQEIFQLDGTLADQEEKPADGLVLERAGDNLDITRTPPPSAVPDPAQEPPVGPPPEASAEVAPPPESEAAKPGRRRQRDKADMLARALVSDILVYNRDTRDEALRSGTLLEALGPEIKKSWELYKNRVTPEVANSTTHFRDALNEILAEGQKVF